MSPSSSHASSRRITFGDFQQIIRTMYFDKDAARGAEATFLWLIEEVGELATAIRTVTSADTSTETASAVRDNLAEEFADCFAWLTTLANILHVDLDAAIAKKYVAGCPGCGDLVCSCDESEKP